MTSAASAPSPHAVAQAVQHKFDALPASLHPKANHWSVLAGITQTLQDGTCRVLSLATGTKCEPPPREDVRDWVVLDSHAEVLARRGLVLLLLKDFASMRESAQSVGHLLVQLPNGRFQVQGQLAMYISDAPCGDAAEFRRLGGGSQRVTGAKPLDPAGRLRTKPGRSDLPSAKRTRCMSCSDKLCRWAVLGMQGALLANWIEPVRLSALVLGQDALLTALEESDGAVLGAEAQQLVLEQLQRSMDRVSGLVPQELRPLVAASPDAAFKFSRPKIDSLRPDGALPKRAKTMQSSGSDFALTWLLDLPACASKFARRKSVAGGWVEVLAKGRRQGASSAAAPQAVCSDLCRGALRAELAASLAAAGVPSADRSYLDSRRAFLGHAEFAGWLGNA